MTIEDRVQDALKKSDYSFWKFFRDYEKTVLIYQDLRDKGLTSRRQYQLLSISDTNTVDTVQFNSSEFVFDEY